MTAEERLAMEQIARETHLKDLETCKLTFATHAFIYKIIWTFAIVMVGIAGSSVAWAITISEKNARQDVLIEKTNSELIDFKNEINDKLSRSSESQERIANAQEKILEIIKRNKKY